MLSSRSAWIPYWRKSYACWSRRKTRSPPSPASLTASPRWFVGTVLVVAAVVGWLLVATGTRQLATHPRFGSRSDLSLRAVAGDTHGHQCRHRYHARTRSADGPQPQPGNSGAQQSCHLRQDRHADAGHAGRSPRTLCLSHLDERTVLLDIAAALEAAIGTPRRQGHRHGRCRQQTDSRPATSATFPVPASAAALPIGSGLSAMRNFIAAHTDAASEYPPTAIDDGTRVLLADSHQLHARVPAARRHDGKKHPQSSRRCESPASRWC